MATRAVPAVQAYRTNRAERAYEAIAGREVGRARRRSAQTLVSGHQGLSHVRQVLASRTLGGADLIGCSLAADVRARGARSSVWLPATGATSARLDRETVRWTTYPLELLARGGWRHGLALAGIAARTVFDRPSVWHIHDPTVYGLMSRALKPQASRVIVHFHIDPTPEEVRWALRRKPAVVATCSRHISSVVSSAVGNRSEGGPHILALPNAIDLERFRPRDRAAAKLSVGADPGRVILLVLANLAPHKGQTTVLHTLRRLLDRGIAAEAWFAGEERGSTTFSQKLRDLTSELRLEPHVRWLGFRSDSETLLAAADYFLLPSTHEGLPLSVLEAQASGTVVLGSDVPGIAEVVDDGETGFLVGGNDPARYADLVAMLLASPETRQRVERAGRRRVEQHHCWNSYVSRIAEAYAEVEHANTNITARR